MNRYIQLLIVICITLTANVYGQGVWQPAPLAAASAAKGISASAQQRFFFLNENELRTSLVSSAGEVKVIFLPMPDGNYREFRVWENSLMPAELAAKYPQIRTFTAEATDQPSVTAKLDFTVYGFHAMVFDGDNTYFIDRSDKNTAGLYAVHYKKDELRAIDEMMHCLNAGDASLNLAKRDAKKTAARTINGYELRTYRLALACDHQYAIATTKADSPTKAQALSFMTTTMNRVNGVYEREVSVTMKFVSKEDTLIFTRAGKDPYGAYNDDASSMLASGVNQLMCDSLVGSANYDIGHVFTTGAGGLSSVSVVCNNGTKAQSVTGLSNPVGDGFDIDYVAHEMGHEFGSDHTFNNDSDGFCGSAKAAVKDFAYEPGSGSTIMAYAGICSPGDLQPHSDAYFCASGLLQLNKFITTSGDSCPIKTPTGNKVVANPLVSASYSIPFLTPFELISPHAYDSVAGTTPTYCWEQWNLGDFGQRLIDTHYEGPIFRSYSPDTSSTRIFPNINMVLAGNLDNSGHENAQGEKAPDVARFLTFRLTLRNLLNGYGTFLFPDDSIHIDAINTGKGFKVTSQGAKDILYLGSTKQIVTWDVVGSTQPPISTPNVDIYLSNDGGYHWPVHLGNFPNTGSAQVDIPNPDTTIHRARIKVKGSGNVFFNINGNDFAIINNPDSTGEIRVFPIPAHNTLNILTGSKGAVQGVIFDVAGRRMWEGEINGFVSLAVSNWPRAMYLVKLIDEKSKVTVRKVVLY